MAEQTPALKEDLSGAQIGRYRVVRRLGRGGMGDVYLAEDPRLKRDVAIKRMGARLRSEERQHQRFLKEAERVSRLNHPHIAAIYDILDFSGETFLVMEYIDGKMLRRHIDDPLNLRQVLSMVLECAEALQAAHDAGVVHRDIKPENIMLTSNGSAKILDFGLAKRMPSTSANRTDESFSGSGTMSGTFAYMAPEALREERLDGRADIFSLGIVLYECLTGQHPFMADTFIETTQRILEQTPTPVNERNPDLPPEVNHVVMKMLAKQPADRHQSASELMADLLALEKKLQFESSKRFASPVRKAILSLPRSGNLRVLQWAVGLIVILSVALVGWKIWRGRLEARPALLSGSRHLAVLPFTTVGGDPGNTAFSDGLSDTLTARLAQLTSKYPLEVVPVSEMRSDRISSVEQAHKAFGVNLVLDGQVHFYGRQVRVNYSLINALDRTLVGAGTVTAEDANPFVMEDRVVDRVLNTLDLELSAQERDAMRARGTSQPEAYQAFLRGRGYLRSNQGSGNSVEDAIAAFSQAIEKDPKYAMAFAGLGEAYWEKYSQTNDPSWLDKATGACERSLRLADEQPDGHACLGKVESSTGRYEQSTQQFGRAVSLDATNDDYYRGLANAYQKLNNIEKAEQTFLQAIDLRPNYWLNYNYLGYLYSSVGRYENAETMFKKVISLAPDSFKGYQNLGGIYLFSGRYADAVTVLEKSIEIRPNAGAYANRGMAHFYLREYNAAAQQFQQAVSIGPRRYSTWMNLGDAYYWDASTRDKAPPAYLKAIELCQQALKVNARDGNPLMVMAMGYAMLGHNAEALSALQRAIAISPRDPEAPYYAALVNARIGDIDSALKWAQKALDAGASAPQFRDSPLLQSLDKDPRVRGFLARLNKKPLRSDQSSTPSRRSRLRLTMNDHGSDHSVLSR